MATDFEEIEVEDETEDESVSVVYDIATYPSDFTLAGIKQLWIDDDIQIPACGRCGYAFEWRSSLNRRPSAKDQVYWVRDCCSSHSLRACDQGHIY